MKVVSLDLKEFSRVILSVCMRNLNKYLWFLMYVIFWYLLNLVIIEGKNYSEKIDGSGWEVSVSLVKFYFRVFCFVF